MSGLMAIGEAACVSVHGANRPWGRNSLSRYRRLRPGGGAIRAAELIKPGEKRPPLPGNAGEAVLDYFDKLRHASGSLPTAQIRLKPAEGHAETICAVFRDGKILKEGIRKLKSVWESFADVGVFRSLDDLEFGSGRDDGTRQSVASSGGGTIHAAHNRTESRGGHAREDYPDRDDENWMKHTLVWWDDKLRPKIDYRPVHMYTLTDDAEVIPPKARVY